MRNEAHLLGNLFALALLAVAPLAAGCSDEEIDPVDSSAEDGIFDLTPGWNTIEPGGDTICSRGTPYRYFVRPGTVNKVVIEFRGGGACWDDLTCAFAKSLFNEEADVDPWVTSEDSPTGIYDHSNEDNPFKDWHHVYIPYCTGDIHWGDNEATYGSGENAFTIQHKGAVNVRAVLDWTYENVTAPEQVMVTGCSAGAYGSIMWSAHVRKHYEKSRVLQLADSGAGVITDTFFQDSFPSWKPESSYPTWMEGVDAASLTRLPQVYEAIGSYYPDMTLSQYNTHYDEDQSFFFAAMGGGDTYAWSDKMNENVDEILDEVPNFASYRAPGYLHCILPRDELYTVESGGVKLVDWINDMVEAPTPESVKDVDCKAGDCGGPEPAK